MRGLTAARARADPFRQVLVLKGDALPERATDQDPELMQRVLAVMAETQEDV